MATFRFTDVEIGSPKKGSYEMQDYLKDKSFYNNQHDQILTNTKSKSENVSMLYPSLE